jgi:hypothetical protein
VIERRADVGATVAAWLLCGCDAIFRCAHVGAATPATGETREITARHPVRRRKTPIRDPN